MRKITLLSVAFLGLILLVGSGCHTRRVITAKSWVGGSYTTLYVAYWEGRCLGSTCSGGETKIKNCVLNPQQNTLVCKQADAAEKALNL